jgi:hypothetical protein
MVANSKKRQIDNSGRNLAPKIYVMFFLHTPNGGFRTAMHILWFFLE